MTNMRCFVTGSTGLLGTTLVRTLLSRGHSVTALVRDKEKAVKLLEPGAEVLVGDITDVKAFAPSLKGVDVIYHAAAYFKEYTGADKEADAKLQAINVDAVINLLDVAKDVGVPTVVHVSSSGTTAPVDGGNEETEYFTKTPNKYFQSKIRAEQRVQEWLKDNPDSVKVVLVRPTAMIGPGDNGPTGLGQSILDVLTGKMPAIPPGALNFVDVRDVAETLIQAGDKGSSGERYLASAEFKTMSELVAEIGNAADNIKVPKMKLPVPIALGFAGMQELVSKIFGTKPLVTRVIMRTLIENAPFDGSKVQKDLGIQYRSFEESIRDEVAWFKENNYY